MEAISDFSSDGILLLNASRPRSLPDENRVPPSLVTGHRISSVTINNWEANLSQRLSANILFNFAGQLYIVILGLAVVPYIVHHLGTELYGVVVLVAAVGLGGSLNLGLGRALAKYVAERGALDSAQRMRSLFQTALATTLPATISAGLLIIAFRNPISANLFHGRTLRMSDVTFAVLLAGLAFGISLLSDCFSGLIVGLQRFDVYNGVNVIQSTVRNLGAVLVLALGLFVRAVLLVYLFASVVTLCVYAYYGRRLIPHLNFRPRFYQDEFKLLGSFAIPVVVAAIGSLVIQRLDRVLLAYFLPISAVAFYVVPYSLAERTGVFVGNVTSVIFPSSSELSSSAMREKLQDLYVRASRMAVLVGLPVAILLIVFPSNILRFWVGSEFAAHGSVLLQILALGYIAFVLGYVPFSIAQGIGHPWTATGFLTLNGALTLAFMLTLIPRYGILGAGVGFSLAQWLGTPLFIWKVNRLVGVSWSSLLRRGYARVFTCGGAALALLSSLRSYTDSLPHLIMCAGTGLAAYVVGAFFIALDSKERIALFGQVTGMLRRLGQASSS